jgi:DDE superfamily endonuclease
MPPENPRPVRVFSPDERRVGFLTVRRRRLTACGVQPVGLVQPTFEWCSIDGAVAPTTGERFVLEVPSLNAESFELFVDPVAPAFPDRFTRRLWDNSGAHTAQRLQWPDKVRAVRLPPYGPELNPMERVWRALKEALAWQQCLDLEAQQLSVGNWLQAYDAPTLQALTG